MGADQNHRVNVEYGFTYGVDNGVYEVLDEQIARSLVRVGETLPV